MPKTEFADNLNETLTPYFYNSWTVDEVTGFILAQDEQWQEYVLNWVSSIAKTQPELAYQYAVQAKTKLLITLSDGNPDDYDSYHDEYGIEDTRMSLFESRLEGIHPFCITIDEEAQDYLPHLYGYANYIVISDIKKLPYKISDIYRKLTT